MMNRRSLSLVVSLAVLATAATAWRLQDRATSGAPPALPDGPRSAWEVIHAQPFRVDEPFVHWWRAEQPRVSAGWILVLTADPDLLVPREAAEPVLYVGDQTAERINKGHLDGALVVVVPGEAGPDGWPATDPAGAAVWFGSPALPERIDAAAIAAERAAAAASGVVPPAAARTREVIAAGIEAPDRSDLDLEIARLVLRYAPSEEDLARGMMVPR